MNAGSPRRTARTLEVVQRCALAIVLLGALIWALHG